MFTIEPDSDITFPLSMEHSHDNILTIVYQPQHTIGNEISRWKLHEETIVV